MHNTFIQNTGDLLLLFVNRRRSNCFLAFTVLLSQLIRLQVSESLLLCTHMPEAVQTVFCSLQKSSNHYIISWSMLACYHKLLPVFLRVIKILWFALCLPMVFFKYLQTERGHYFVYYMEEITAGQT